MTNRNKPNVKIVIGSVNKTKIGFTIKFSIAKTIATIIDTPKLATKIPGRKFEINNTSKAVTRIRIIKFMCAYFG